MKSVWPVFLWSFFFAADALADTAEPRCNDEKKTSARTMSQLHAPADTEFWDLYDELADEMGRLPAPDEIPPPKDPLLPSSTEKSAAALEDL